MFAVCTELLEVVLPSSGVTVKSIFWQQASIRQSSTRLFLFGKSIEHFFADFWQVVLIIYGVEEEQKENEADETAPYEQCQHCSIHTILKRKRFFFAKLEKINRIMRNYWLILWQITVKQR